MPPARAPRGMVASPHPLATAAGVDALRAGGTAVDAAVAANAMLAVVYCNACGLGGDAFALVWDPGERRLHAFNGSGRSPAAITIEQVRRAGHEQMPERGPLSVTVPGAVDAWVQLLERFGRRSLGDAIGPASRTADDGYELTAVNVAGIRDDLVHFDRAARAVFTPAGRVPRRGDTLRQPLLAQSLRAIARGGRGAYYGGPLGEEIARAVQAAGGSLAADDIAAHRGDWVDPIATGYLDCELATPPPNSQGITALIALNVLSALTQNDAWPPPRRFDAGAPLDADRLHAQIESLKVAWSERDRCVTDPDRELLTDPGSLLTAHHATRLASRLSAERARRQQPTNPPGSGTVYLCAADGDGMIVSLMESNYMGFGSGVMAGTTGIMLHNRGAYFSLDPSHPNALAPASRTLHTLMPAMLLRDGQAHAALGSKGGDGQPQIIVQLVNALLDDRLDVQAAVDRPRFVLEVEARGAPLGPVRIESDGATDELLAKLRGRGHEVTPVPPRSPEMGWAQVIRRSADGGYEAGADPRADSLAAGL